VGLPGILAATDGSVCKETDSMGAGVAFCPLSLAALGSLGDEMQNCCASVGGPPSSLRAEAAALYLLLLETPPFCQLTVLMDSLGLLQTLQRWGRLDFSPRPEVQKHLDIICPILELLAARSETTTFVKVKSHSGVPLNEAADVLADMGTESPEFMCEYDSQGAKLTPFTCLGEVIPNLNTFLREAQADLLRKQLVATDGIMSRGFLSPVRGQRFLEKAKRSMRYGERRRLLQNLGGVFPCNHWRHRIGLSASPDCPLCCSLDHFSHRVLTCGAMADAITAAHDTIWSDLFGLITAHLPADWKSWKDKVISTTGIPCCDLAHLKPDGVLLHEPSKVIYVLEFKRASDFFPDSFERGFLRKFIRYQPLVEALEAANPGWDVQLTVFCLGDRGLLEEERWLDNWSILGLPASGFLPFATTAARLAQTVATTILECYSAALRALHTAPSS
jgi:ribonuclease HI